MEIFFPTTNIVCNLQTHSYIDWMDFVLTHQKKKRFNELKDFNCAIERTPNEKQIQKKVSKRIMWTGFFCVRVCFARQIENF